MKLWKKVVLGFLSVLLVVVAGVCAYGIKMYSDANSTINGIYQSVNRKSNKEPRPILMRKNHSLFF